jgi:tetratricopeptide (TPR) repeat protein
MKSVSRFALALAVSSLSLTASAGAWAADEKPKKEKGKKGKEEAAPAAPQAALSKEFRAVYEPVVKAYTKDKNAVTAAASWETIKAAIKTEDDRYQAGLFGYQIGGEAKNDAMRNEAMDMVIASTFTPADQRAAYTFQKAAVAYDKQDWPNAETWLIKAHEAGYKSPSIKGGVEWLVADSLFRQKKNEAALDWIQKSLDSSKRAGALALPDNFFVRSANIALATRQGPVVAKWMQELVRSQPTADFWQDGVSQTLKFYDLDVQETLDLMRLLRMVGGMKYEGNYLNYATPSMAAFFPVEIKALLEEGFNSNTISKSKLTFKDLYDSVDEKLKVDPFSLAQLDADIAAAKSGFDSANAGDIALSVGEYAKAIASYEKALAAGSIVDREGKDLADRTVMRLGMAKAKTGDFAGARAALAKVVTPSRKTVADFWSIYIDQLEKGAAPAAAPTS